jgi:hypothetical protein
MAKNPLLEVIYGADLGYDNDPRLSDVVENDGADFQYPPPGPLVLAEELERLFITPRGSLVDNPTYGIDWEVIGTNLDPRVTLGMTRLAVLNALEHPSFASRFRVADLRTDWTPSTPNAVYVWGVLECFGFSGAAFQFGPIALELSRQ